MNIRVLLVVALLHIGSAIGTLGYSDADNPSQAVGMIKGQGFAADIMLQECSKRFPNLVGEFKTNFEKWRTSEAAVRKKAEKYGAQMVVKEKSLLETPGNAEQAVKGQFEILEKMKMQGTDEVKVQFCRQHFSDLASGTWRERTPNAYRYLDRASE